MAYSYNIAIRLIDIQAVDQPESVCESRRVVLHIIVAGVGEGGAIGAGAPNSSGPVAAEVCVEDLGIDPLVSKLVVAGCRGPQERKGIDRESRCRSESERTICISAKWLGMSQSP